MTAHVLLVPLSALALLPLSARAAAPPPTDLVKALNQATTRDQYVSMLRALGFTLDELQGAETQTSGSLAEVSIFKKDYFRRAEAFTAHLTGDAVTQTIIQVVFHVVDYQAPFPTEGAKVYFVAILDDQAHDYAPLARRLYDLTLCGPGDPKDEKWENAMSFAFRPVPERKFKQLAFGVTDVDACAMQIATIHHTDTLTFDGKKFVFHPGEAKRDDPVNRMDPESLK